MSVAEPSVIDNELELRALVTGVRLASTFTLGFVVVNAPALHGVLLQRLHAEFGAESVYVVRVEDDQSDLLERIEIAAQPAEVKVVVVSAIVDIR